MRRYKCTLLYIFTNGLHVYEVFYGIIFAPRLFSVHVRALPVDAINFNQAFNVPSALSELNKNIYDIYIYIYI